MKAEIQEIRAIKETNGKLSTKDSLSQNHQYDSETKEKEIEIWKDMEQNKERIKLLGIDVYVKQVSMKQTRTERSTEGIHQLEDNGTKQRLLEKPRKSDKNYR